MIVIFRDMSNKNAILIRDSAIQRNPRMEKQRKNNGLIKANK